MNFNAAFFICLLISYVTCISAAPLDNTGGLRRIQLLSEIVSQNQNLAAPNNPLSDLEFPEDEAVRQEADPSSSPDLEDPEPSTMPSSSSSPTLSVIPSASFPPVQSPLPSSSIVPSAPSAPSSSQTPSPSSTMNDPKPSPATISPCRDSFVLVKVYTDFPSFTYTCQKHDRTEAQLSIATCSPPDDYFQREGKCFRRTDDCSTTLEELLDPSCIKPVCGNNAIFRRMAYNKPTCIGCPDGYELYMDSGQHRCYKLLVEAPECPGSKTFSSTTATCV